MEQIQQDINTIRRLVRNDGENKQADQFGDIREFSALANTIINNYQSGIEGDVLTDLTLHIIQNIRELEVSKQEVFDHFTGLWEMNNIEKAAVWHSIEPLQRLMFGNEEV